jgi:hypothetical protein
MRSMMTCLHTVHSTSYKSAQGDSLSPSVVLLTTPTYQGLPSLFPASLWVFFCGASFGLRSFVWTVIRLIDVIFLIRARLIILIIKIKKITVQTLRHSAMPPCHSTN